MKLKFKHQKFQELAVKAVADLFTGQEKKTASLENRHFNIEMETGTGKTYVYTKTIFELHKRFGFTKFIIVVPSVAIREGVYKSFQVTQEHFGLQYDNAPCRYFIYNSARLSDVRQFATSANIEIMIINIDAFKKSENVINQAQDRLSGESAMRFIPDTNPFNLRTPEALKIHCGKRHFKALGSGVELRAARDWKEFRTNI